MGMGETRKECAMEAKRLLEAKKILIVDDEPDILDTLEDLLPMCTVSKASTFQEAKEALERRPFDVAILDIMGVNGYDLLEIATKRRIIPVMLTAYALSPEDIKKSYMKGAAYYLPKEEIAHIASFLEDILEDVAAGKNPWQRWYHRLAAFCEKKFGPEWKSTDREFWENFPFY